VKLVLVFDLSVIGFARRYRRILELKGIEVVIPPRSIAMHDPILHRYAMMLGGIVVTSDKGFPDPKILLPMERPKYEKWHTVLMREVNRILHRSRGDDEPTTGLVTPRTNHATPPDHESSRLWRRGLARSEEA